MTQAAARSIRKWKVQVIHITRHEGIADVVIEAATEVEARQKALNAVPNIGFERYGYMRMDPDKFEIGEIEEIT
jgi:hypothetical protein